MKRVKQSDYITGKLVWEIYLIKGKERCFDCPLCKYETGFGRYYCGLTYEMLYDPKIIGLGRACPLTFEVAKERKE